MENRTSSRKTRVGLVVSDKMDKTVVVAIADRAGLAERTAHDAEAHNFLSAGVIGDFKTRLRLNH